MFTFMSTSDYQGYTNIKSVLTQHLFQNFKKAHFHFKERIQDHQQLSATFYRTTEELFEVFCDGSGKETHIPEHEIATLHERVEMIVDVLKTMDLNDQDKIMQDIIVKTGNYLAIILDFIKQEARFTQQDIRLRTLEIKHAHPRVESVVQPHKKAQLDDSLRSLCLLAQDAYITP